MKRFQKFVAVVALGGIGSASWFMGNNLVRDVRFARADSEVQASRQDLQGAKDLQDVFRAVGKAVEPSVVSIEVEKTIKGSHQHMDEDFLRRFFPNLPQNPNGGGNGGDGQDQQQQQQQPDQPDNSEPNQQGQDEKEIGEGSGVIMDAADGYGYILTNNHVAGGASKMTVTLYNGDIIDDAKLVGADPKSDLAVVRIKADHLIPAKWGDSDELEKGDWICAFGAPFNFVGSMTHGIVSALNRQNVGIIDRNSGFSYENFIQVDAPINPGNSGGPLVNLRGEVVGINTAIASRSGGFQGIGFAIPSDQAHPIYDALKSKGKVTRGWLGVEIHDVNQFKDEVAAAGFTGNSGVFVKETMLNTPATGKLQAGDVITAINGKSVATSSALRNQIALTPPNTNVTLTVFRNGKQQDVVVKLGEQPDDLSAIASGGAGHHQNQDSDTVSAESLGIQLTNVTDELSTKYNLQNAKSGAVVTSLEPNSPAAMAGLSIGDLITRVGNTDVADAGSAADAISKGDPAKGIALHVTNREGSKFVFIKTEK
jgi:serine protease Do